MKKILPALLILFVCLDINGQITFQKTFGGIDNDIPRCVELTNDAGYIVTGYVKSFGVGTGDVYLIKINSIGDTVWTRTFGGVGIDNGYSVQQTSDGGYIVAGSTTSFGAGLEDVYLIKTDGAGTILWTKTFGGINNDWGYSVQQTFDGGYVIAGATLSFGAGNWDVYLIKTDASGNLLWTKTFGGTDDDWGYSVQQTIDSGYIVTGYGSSFSMGAENVYLIKTDINGNLAWSKAYGGINGTRGYSVQQTADGGYVIGGGVFGFGAGAWDVYLIKTDAAGNLLWSKTFGGTDEDYAFSVQQISNGGYIIAGQTHSFGMGNVDVYLVSTDAGGNLIWAKTFGGINDDWGYSVKQTIDLKFVIAAHTYSFGSGLTDVYLIKTDSIGNSVCNQSNATVTITTSPATATTNFTAAVSSGGTIGNPLTITGNGTNITTPCLSTLQWNTLQQSIIIISPNPATTAFTISDVRGTISEIEMYNVMGEKVFSKSQISNSNHQAISINVSDFSPGVYFVKMFSEQDSVTRKIVVQR